MMSTEDELSGDSTDEHRLVRPKSEFQSLLKEAGATKEVFTMQEVLFFLGQYIIQKQLYDQRQQHLVHCSQDALGRVLGVASFSIKEPRVLFAMIKKNLETVKNTHAAAAAAAAAPPGGSGGNSSGGAAAQEAESDSESRSSSSERRRRRRRSSRSNDPGPSHSVEDEGVGPDSEEEEEEEGRRKRRRSDSYSLTFDDSMSWCVIGGLRSGRDRHLSGSQSETSHSTTARSVASGDDSDSDNFSVEFEVESIDSDDYNEDDASVSADEQVYEVTIFEGNEDEDDSFDEDLEITEADYWRCGQCDELNPPLPRNCLRCWTLRIDWLPEELGDLTNSAPKGLPKKPDSQSAAKEALVSDVDDFDGVDVPDGKRAETPLSDSAPSAPDSTPSSQDLCFSQPSSSLDSQELLPLSQTPKPLSADDSGSSAGSASATGGDSVPDLQRSVSEELRLPESCLDPCLICQSRPKNGCIVHGRTGHLMSCYICARKLKKRNKLCPVCRLPIQTVVLTYLS